MSDAEDQRELTPEEATSREQLTKWKNHHENQLQQGKASYILKGSLTRAKRCYEECYRLAQQVIEQLVDEDAKTAAKAQLDDFEVEELEWQDEKAHHIHLMENPAPQVNAQMTQASKNARYEILLIKAQSRARCDISACSHTEELRPINHQQSIGDYQDPGGHRRERH